MTHARYCKDCKHYEVYKRVVAEICLSPNLPTDLVTGRPKFTLCKDLRYSIWGTEVACGEDGKWFESKIDEAADLDDLSTIPFGKQP